ncbi:hypothetical protein STAFG_2119 [Streptomyces afghaniensis 772]|uniref:TPM domain-containing protein n=1 Tax=Streptomyces afghaniensis 772 TaxID=1283301 RepID=S4MMM9_9ACTN|nr:hypothetical protein [Streptomyces afghaniensis]EPJ40818.1 hypothetical protein STAFG_2119 [Streptomyces afghaniensis 772]
MSTDVKRLITVLAALLLAALTTTPARAADGDAPSAGQRIAEALRTSPVYVDEAYADAVPPSRQRQLADRIRRTGLPVKVVLTPLTKGDAFDGDSGVLAGIVRDRLQDQRELILITTDGDFPDSLNGYEWPADTHQTRDAVTAAGLLDETRDAGLADLTAEAVDLVAEGKGTQRYEEAVKELDGSAAPGAQTSGSPASESSSDGTGGWWLWPLIAVPTLALTALATRALVRSRRTPSAIPQLVFASARAADEAELRHRAEAEVLALGEATQAADVSTTPALQRALDAYAAAGRVLDEARGVPDLAGVLALAQEGRDALACSPALPLCFFDPRHGRAALRTGWRQLGRRDWLDVAVCQGCADALRARRAPEVLTDTDEDGRTVPYFELQAGRSVWAATGYGSLMSPLDGFNTRRTATR